MNTLGNETKSRFYIDPEAHKLSYSFVVEAAQEVHKGDPVVLTATGTVQAAAAAAPAYTIIGHSIHDGEAGEDVTIVMKAYTVVYAEAAADALVPGPVQLGAWNATTGRREYAVAAGADDTAKAIVTVGHSLDTGDNGDEIKVALF